MKVPLERDPFAPVTLSSDQENQLKWLSDAMVDATLSQYEEFVTKHNRVLEKEKWKPVISRENVTIYRRAGKGDLGGYTPKISLAQPTSGPTSEYWRVPVALGFGTMAGALDDMLYGLLAMTKTETDVRTTYIKDEAPDSRVLATVIKPTREDPLQALVLRWSLIYQSLHKIGVATPRDLVYLESVGSRILPSGEKVGYAVMQSVDVPGCGELKELGVVRCKFSTVYLLRDTGTGSVELYMRSFLEPGGRLGDRLAVFLSCTSLIAIWRVMLCGQYKKLAWMFRQAPRTRPSASGHDGTCPICKKSISGLRSPSQCEICMTRVCSRCYDKRKLTQVVSRKQIKQVATCVCRTCISVASRTSARDVALNEYVSANEGRMSSWSESRSPCNQSEPQTPSRTVRLLNRTLSSSATLPFTSSGTTVDTSIRQSDLAATPSTAVAEPRFVEDEAHAGVDPDKLQLWIRMNQLRMAAEETFLITKQTEAVMLETLSVSSNTADDETSSVASRSLTVEEVDFH